MILIVCFAERNRDNFNIRDYVVYEEDLEVWCRLGLIWQSMVRDGR